MLGHRIRLPTPNNSTAALQNHASQQLLTTPFRTALHYCLTGSYCIVQFPLVATPPMPRCSTLPYPNAVRNTSDPALFEIITMLSLTTLFSCSLLSRSRINTDAHTSGPQSGTVHGTQRNSSENWPPSYETRHRHHKKGQ